VAPVIGYGSDAAKKTFISLLVNYEISDIGSSSQKFHISFRVTSCWRDLSGNCVVTEGYDCVSAREAGRRSSEVCGLAAGKAGKMRSMPLKGNFPKRSI
jgi:hypothetical protein